MSELIRTRRQTENLTCCDYVEQFNTWTAGRCLRLAEFEIVSRATDGTGGVKKENYCSEHYDLIATPLRPRYPDRTAY